MTTDLPTHLGGWQNVVFGKVEEGDLLIPENGGIKDARWAFSLVGEPIESEYIHGNFRVYRKMPVSKQGDLDHVTFPRAQLPDLVGEHEARMLDGLSKSESLRKMVDQLAESLVLPSDPTARKRIPIATGFCFYFPRAMAAVAAVSLAGNEQHNPGKPLHWDRSKSSDEDDAMMRHFLERDAVDKDGHLHAAKAAWRAMARLEKMLEADERRP